MSDPFHPLEGRFDHDNRHDDDVLGSELQAWLRSAEVVEHVGHGSDARNFPTVLLRAVRQAQHVAVGAGRAGFG